MFKHITRHGLVILFALHSVYSSVAALTQDEKMTWWREARFGMFIHWGAYSQLHGWWDGTQKAGYGEWIMYDYNIPKSDYETNAAAPFNPTQFDAAAWVGAAKGAGQKYIVITSKHHEGFSMYPTKVNNFTPYDIVNYTQWKQDPLEKLSSECKKQGVVFCIYYSIMDWHHPLQSNLGANISNKAQYVTEMKAQLKELIENYDPGMIWFDGEWNEWWTTADGVDLHSFLLALKPDLIVNNRIGKRGVEDGDFGTPEQKIPETGLDYDWESCMTINETWGYKDFDTNWKSTLTLLQNLIDCASKGGNYLLNVGPTDEGIIPQESIDRLSEMGAWMKTNGQSVYGTRASIFEQTLAWGKVTVKSGAVYLHILNWPSNNQITIPLLGNTINKVHLLCDTATELAHTANASEMTITLPTIKPNELISVVKLDVNGEPRQLNQLINDKDSGFTYSSGWSTSTGERKLGDYKDDVHYSTTDGSWFEYPFHGTGIEYLTEKNSDMGGVDIYLDGSYRATASCSNPTRLAQQVVYRVVNLSNENHVLRAVKKNGTYMLLDALRVLRQVDQPVGATLQPAKRDNEFPVRIVSICGKLSITVEKIPAGGATLRIYKPNGTIVREVKAEVAQTLDIKSLANGVYYYTLISAHAMSKPAVIRIVK